MTTIRHEPRARTLRRTAVLPGLAMVAALLPAALATAPPAAAAVDCVNEAPQQPLGLQRCDDVTPPTTTLTGVTPEPNAGRWLRTGEVSIAFTGAFAPEDDTDADPLGFQCKLDGPSQSQGWRACTSPWRPPQPLSDSGSASYTFSVRAVDTADHDKGLTGSPDGDGTLYPASPLLGIPYPAETVPDFDATPATTSFKVDSKAPVGLLFGQPLDPFTPDDPVLLSRDLTLTLRTNEPGSTFSCVLDAVAVPCSAGRNTFSGLGSRRHSFAATLVDPAGNVTATDPAELTTSFTVATDVFGTKKQRRKWKFVKSPGALGGSYLETDRQFATLTLRGRNVRELRLLAPTAPGDGLVRVRINRTKWHKVNLNRRADDKAQFRLRGPGFTPQTGQIQIQVISRGKPVRIDGIVAR